MLRTTTCPALEPFVEIKDAKFAYGSRQILKGITLTVPRGKVVAIMGGSGCGKTTLLRLIGGQHKIRKGSLTVAGKEVRTLDKEGLYTLRRSIGMLYQFGALFTDMSVFDNVAFPLREHTDLSAGMIRDLVLMKLHAVGLRGAAQLLPNELSGGMARRVALARAIALDPEVVMYDEPFAGLDPISLTVISQLIRNLNDVLGLTSILVTHDVVESLKIVDYVYFMAGGKVVGEGTPATIRKSEDPFIQQFIHGHMNGPQGFHYPAPPMLQSLGLTKESA